MCDHGTQQDPMRPPLIDPHPCPLTAFCLQKTLVTEYIYLEKWKSAGRKENSQAKQNNILTIKQEDYTFVSYLNGTKIAKLDTNEVLKKDHIVISYTRKETIFAANLDVTIANLPALDNAKLTITDSINPDGVYQLTYYPAAANDTEIRFLLN